MQQDFGTADPVEFEQWRSQSPAHAIAFARAWAAWERVEAVHQDALDTVARSDGADDDRTLVRPSRRGLLRAAVAGCTAFVAAGGVFTARAYAWSRAETGIGEMRRLHLPDGSALVLNTDSAVAWRFHDDAHVVRLERGEIALEVAPTSSMLSLTTATLSAQLSAGRFNARLKDGGLDIVVIRGVAQSPQRTASSGVMAARDQALVVTDMAARVQSASSQALAATMAWPTGEILLHDEPLSAAVAEYNRYLSLKIVIADPDLGGIRVAGRFTSTDPSDFLEALHTTLNVDVKTTPRGYILTGKKFI